MYIWCNFWKVYNEHIWFVWCCWKWVQALSLWYDTSIRIPHHNLNYRSCICHQNVSIIWVLDLLWECTALSCLKRIQERRLDVRVEGWATMVIEPILFIYCVHKHYFNFIEQDDIGELGTIEIVTRVFGKLFKSFILIV